MRNIKRPPRNSDFQNMKILSAPLARRRREIFEVFGYFVSISKGVLNSFVWNLKILSAPQISRDFEKILSAPLRIQISRKIYIKRPPNLVPADGKGGFYYFMDGSPFPYNFRIWFVARNTTDTKTTGYPRRSA